MAGACRLTIRMYLLVVAGTVLLGTGTALGLPCSGQSFSMAETKEEVAAKCGEAMYKEQRHVREEEITGKGPRRATTTCIDEWAYNFGPDEQMQSFRFENGRLVEIRNIGYGRRQDDMDDTCRNGELLAVGDSSLEVFLKCGEPIAKEILTDKTVESASGGTKRRTTVAVVEWTYRYGPETPGYTLRIENGQVTDIRTRAFGK